MNLRRKIVTMALAGVMTFGVFAGAMAAGLGVVDMGYLLQKHPGFAKASATWQSDVKKANADFASQVKGQATDKDKQELARKFNIQLNQDRINLFSPLEKDIITKTQEVKDEKGLDYVVLKGSVVFGTAQDITNDVEAKLK
jgi:outer membrane protein